MILEDWITIIIPSCNAKYYREKGYILDIPTEELKYIKKYQTDVNINDLPYYSNTTVTRICDECGKIDIVSYANHDFTLCVKCAAIASKNPKYVCSHCGTKITKRRSLNIPLCKTCYDAHIFNIGHKNHKLSTNSRLNLFWKSQNGDLNGNS